MTHLRKIYIRAREGVPGNTNCFAAYDGFREMGVEIAWFEESSELPGLEDLGSEVGVHGFVGNVHQALRRLGASVPAALDYPDSLRGFLGREVRQTTLREVRESTDPVFVKPMEHKLFTGFVFDGCAGARMRLATHESSTQVWVSDVVEFVAEYRVFVLDGEILDARRYTGRWDVALPFRSEIERAVREYAGAPRAYALDFGVTGDGAQLLVEANDGFALGNYGLSSIPYAKMIDARWEELTRSLA